MIETPWGPEDLLTMGYGIVHVQLDRYSRSLLAFCSSSDTTLMHVQCS
jgi:hypothetical protein